MKRAVRNRRLARGRLAPALCVFLVAAGCSKGSGPAGNSASRYTDSLRQDVQKAREAADRAQRAIADESQRTDEAFKITD